MKRRMTELHPTVHVIEDEPSMRRFLRATLLASGYQVREAATAQEGLTPAAMFQPEIILLDLGLPDLDGLEVTRRLHEWASIPIIILSARDRESDKIAALYAGADDYLTKPFDMGALLARLRVALCHAIRPPQAARRAGAGAYPSMLSAHRARCWISPQDVLMRVVLYR
jgi:two-component system KDP operon response regulator KdpE